MRWKTFWQGFLEGLASLASIFPTFDVQGYPHKSEKDALASDWRAIEGDMGTVFRSGERDRRQ